MEVHRENHQSIDMLRPFGLPANCGVKPIAADARLEGGLDLCDGKVTCRPAAENLGLAFRRGELAVQALRVVDDRTGLALDEIYAN